MTSSYAVLADQGYKTPAYGINRVASLAGEVIFEAHPDDPRERILSETTVQHMNQMLRGVVTGGTGKKADVPGVPVVGKSGTTSSYRDAWFCGFTGNYVAAVWFGNDDYHPTRTLTGGNLPAVAWQKFMAYAHSNIEIKPVFGLDFVPEQTVIATADPAQIEETPAERPPTLKPAAARKLVDMADLLQTTLRATLPVTDQASTPIPVVTNGL